MNKQLKRNPDGSIRSRGIEWTDYTWNPIGGCSHGCRWQMPDGSTAVCYAETIAERVARTMYTEGFNHHYWRPHMLKKPLKVSDPARIFLDSMSDLMDIRVPDDHVNRVLDTVREAHWHQFQALTKNAPRYRKFTLPANLWAGVSSPPDTMRGRTLRRPQQEAMLHTSLKTLAGLDVPVRWMSFEPLSWGVADIVTQHPGAIQWAVIGAATNGRAVYAPETAHVQRLVDVLDRQGVAVFYKGNLRSVPWARDNWREEFPQIEKG